MTFKNKLNNIFLFDNNKNMKKMYLIKNPEIFQGEKNLSKKNNYFEGWYFKNTNNENGISFIPGINIEDKKEKAFIQVITKNESHYIDYDIEEFEFYHNPFKIKIGSNTFSKDGINIDINSGNVNISGKIEYSDNKNIKTTNLSPNIMGPFSYIPFMECNHAILSMQNKARGEIEINNKKLKFEDGIGYIEKDWGTSFPKDYIWCQGNNFENPNTSLLLAIADIPLKVINFRGFICVLKVENEEFKFTTYNNSKLIQYDLTNDPIEVAFKRKNYELKVKTYINSGQKLSAPVKGKMEKNIVESISSNMEIVLKKDDKIIFSDKSTSCGLEIVD